MIKMKYSDVEWIGDIPQNWNTKKFKYFFDIIGGNGFKDEFQGNETGDIPFCKASDINGSSKYVSTAKNYVSNELAQSQRYNIVPINSILISKIGEALRKNHRKINTIPCIVDNNCEAFTTNRNDNIDYLYYVMKYIDMDWFDNGGTIPSVNNSKLREFYLPFPNISVQEEIANYLDKKCAKIDSIIEKQQVVIGKLKEYKLSIITEAVTKGIESDADMKESEIEWVGKMPVHWIKCRLCDVTKRIIVGLATSVTPYYRQEGVVLLRNLNIKEGYLDDNELLYLDIDFAENQTGKFINEGDVLTVHTGSNLGLSCVVPSKYANTLSFTTLITTPLTEKLLPEYLMYTINSGLGKSEIDRLKCGDIKPNLNVRQFKYFTIFLPPIDEQKKIVVYLEKKCEQIDNLILKKSKEIEKLQEYKKSLIYEAVTGKKEV